MKWLTQVKLIISGFSLSVLLLSIVSLIAYQNLMQLIVSDDKVKHTHKVLKTLTDVLTTLMDAESGRRGYLLLRDEEEIERYHLAVQSICPQINLCGTGLGLAIVKKCVELHNGMIQFQSHLGIGTTFIVKILQPVS